MMQMLIAFSIDHLLKDNILVDIRTPKEIYDAMQHQEKVQPVPLSMFTWLGYDVTYDADAHRKAVTYFENFTQLMKKPQFPRPQYLGPKGPTVTSDVAELIQKGGWEV